MEQHEIETVAGLALLAMAAADWYGVEVTIDDCSPHWAGVPNGALGFTRICPAHGVEAIGVRAGLEPPRMLGTLAHELTHAFRSGEASQGSYEAEEVSAEVGARVILA